MPASNNTGLQMSQPPADGEEIVISGLAGCFPESENVYQFRDNLFNKVDMITDDDRRWNLGQFLCYFHFHKLCVIICIQHL
jgi:fatty acid synthase